MSSRSSSREKKKNRNGPSRKTVGLIRLRRCHPDPMGRQSLGQGIACSPDRTTHRTEVRGELSISTNRRALAHARNRPVKDLSERATGIDGGKVSAPAPAASPAEDGTVAAPTPLQRFPPSHQPSHATAAEQNRRFVRGSSNRATPDRQRLAAAGSTGNVRFLAVRPRGSNASGARRLGGVRPLSRGLGSGSSVRVRRAQVASVAASAASERRFSAEAAWRSSSRAALMAARPSALA